MTLKNIEWDSKRINRLMPFILKGLLKLFSGKKVKTIPY